jgi:RNA polymerase-binding transcription factor DksA
MDRETVKYYRNSLLEQRTRLRGDASQMACAPDCEMTLRLLTSKEQMLQEIEYALERIEDGVFGKCTQCDRRISKARLAVIPYTTLCTACAARASVSPDEGSRKTESEGVAADHGRIPRRTGRPAVGPLAARGKRAKQTVGRPGSAAR